MTVSEQQHRWLDCFRERWIDECIHVGMVYNKALRRQGISPLCKSIEDLREVDVKILADRFGPDAMAQLDDSSEQFLFACSCR
jgi:hypothetical protein